jgi:hypothetical protein
MATDIHQVGSENPPSSEKDRVDEKNTAVTSDVEGNFDDDSKRLVADRAEATELTPVEAFKWNVEGDQSPCKAYPTSLFHGYLPYGDFPWRCSPRGAYPQKPFIFILSRC